MSKYPKDYPWIRQIIPATGWKAVFFDTKAARDLSERYPYSYQDIIAWALMENRVEDEELAGKCRFCTLEGFIPQIDFTRHDSRFPGRQTVHVELISLTDNYDDEFLGYAGPDDSIPDLFGKEIEARARLYREHWKVTPDTAPPPHPGESSPE